jgi:hypothetical protein
MTEKKDPADLKIPIILDPSKAEALAALQCTFDEIASGLGVSLSTLERRRKENPELDEAIKRGRELGKRSIRRLQYDAAKKGNVTMLIWLGKQWLKQADKVETEHTGDIHLHFDERAKDL